MIFIIVTSILILSVGFSYLARLVNDVCPEKATTIGGCILAFLFIIQYGSLILYLRRQKRG